MKLSEKKQTSFARGRTFSFELLADRAERVLNLMGLLVR
jgi:hypothetical protein